MKLYYTKGSCSLAVRILIHELGLKAEYIAVDLKTKKTEHGEDFYQINPKGAVPTLVTDDNQVITENSIIQQYLADSYHAKNLLPAVGELARYKNLELLNYVSNDIHKSFSPIFNPKVPQDIKHEIFLPLLNAKFDYLDKQLANKKFLAGNEYTLSDGYFFVTIFWLDRLQIDSSAWKNIARYYNELKNRKSIEQAFGEEGLVLAEKTV